MVAGLSVMMAPSGRDHCAVVVKGTFNTDAQGHLTLAAEQRPLATKDEHHGAPESTSIRDACDFVLSKPMVDVVVVGKAVAPGGKAVTELPVRLEVDGRTKDAIVVGDRTWRRAVLSVSASHPKPFLEMPLTWECAFGGPDDVRNLVGVGFHAKAPAATLEGKPLPNLERLGQLIKSPQDKTEPIGFGPLPPVAPARLKYAGTYDARWLEDVAPFLTADFDSRFFQSAPEDQRFKPFRGGELIRCVHMDNDVPLRAEGVVTATRQALAEARLAFHQTDFRISDAAGESYHFKEQALLVSRLLRQRKVDFPLWLCAESLGDTGAAAGLCGLITAIAAQERGETPGPNAVAYAGNAQGKRAALVLQLSGSGCEKK